jgi:hypothetical protein
MTPEVECARYGRRESLKQSKQETRSKRGWCSVFLNTQDDHEREEEQVVDRKAGTIMTVRQALERHWAADEAMLP